MACIKLGKLSCISCSLCKVEISSIDYWKINIKKEHTNKINNKVTIIADMMPSSSSKHQVHINDAIFLQQS